MSEEHQIANPKNPFFKSVLGKVIRWLAFIPVAIILTTIIENTLYWSSAFIYGHIIGALVVVVILGIPVLGLAVMIYIAYFWAIVLAVGIICPTPKVGVGIYGTIYTIESIMVFSQASNEFPLAVTTINTIAKVLFIIAAIIALIVSYSEEYST